MRRDPGRQPGGLRGFELDGSFQHLLHASEDVELDAVLPLLEALHERDAAAVVKVAQAALVRHDEGPQHLDARPSDFPARVVVVAVLPVGVVVVAVLLILLVAVAVVVVRVVGHEPKAGLDQLVLECFRLLRAPHRERLEGMEDVLSQVVELLVLLILVPRPGALQVAQKERDDARQMDAKAKADRATDHPDGLDKDTDVLVPPRLLDALEQGAHQPVKHRVGQDDRERADARRGAL